MSNVLKAPSYNPNLTIEESTKEEFLLNNLRLVYHAMKRYQWFIDNTIIEEGDLFSIGYIGLDKAYENFDPSYGVKFSTYAVPKILGEFQRTVRDFDPGAKFPRICKEIGASIMKLLASKDLDLMDVAPEWIAEELDKDIKDVKSSLVYLEYRKCINIGSPMFKSEDSKTITLEDMLEDTNIEDVDRSVILADFKSNLTERDRKILDMYLTGRYTQYDIGDVVGMSQVQVSRILAKIERLANKYNEGFNIKQNTKWSRDSKEGTPEKEKAIEMLKAGKHTMASIARTCNVAESTVSRWRKKLEAQGFI